MWLVSFCCCLTILQSSLTDSFVSLSVALTAVITAIAAEWVVNLKSGTHTLQDGSVITSALVLSLLLPNHTNPLFVIAGVLFAVIVVKHSFGGLGSNWMNPALGGWLFIRLSWPAGFDRALESSPLALLSQSLNRGLSDPHGSPLEILRMTGSSLFAAPGGGGSGLLGDAPGEFFTEILNRTVFALTRSELPGGYIDLFFSRGPGIIGDRGLLALLLGTIVITAFRVSRSWIPAVFLGAYVLWVRIFGALPFGGYPGHGDMIFALFSGGLIPAAFLLVSDPATGPKSRLGAGICAFIAGSFAFLFRYPGAEPYGAFFAAALFNALVPLIRDCERRGLYDPAPDEKRRSL
jgi:electron transport complex protein RnfD